MIQPLRKHQETSRNIKNSPKKKKKLSCTRHVSSPHDLTISSPHPASVSSRVLNLGSRRIDGKKNGEIIPFHPFIHVTAPFNETMVFWDREFPHSIGINGGVCCIERGMGWVDVKMMSQLISGWWLGHPSEKYESHLGWWDSQ